MALTENISSKNSTRCAKKYNFFIILAMGISGMPTPEICFLHSSWAEGSCPRSATTSHSVSVNRTHNLPIERRTRPLGYRRPSEIFVANA